MEGFGATHEPESENGPKLQDSPAAPKPVLLMLKMPLKTVSEKGFFWNGLVTHEPVGSA